MHDGSHEITLGQSTSTSNPATALMFDWYPHLWYHDTSKTGMVTGAPIPVVKVGAVVVSVAGKWYICQCICL